MHVHSLAETGAPLPRYMRTARNYPYIHNPVQKRFEAISAVKDKVTAKKQIQSKTRLGDIKTPFIKLFINDPDNPAERFWTR